MSKPSGYLLHGTAFSSKEAAFEVLVHNREQELRFNKLWNEDAQPYYFESQPRLTIPREIAEIVDKTWYSTRNFGRCDWYPEVISDWWNQPNFNPDDIIFAYLAGKALGVELVEVIG